MSFEKSFAFFGTIYNNVQTVDLTLGSILTVIDFLPDINFEIAVVDNYSSDGSFENSSTTKEFLNKGVMSDHLRF